VINVERFERASITVSFGPEHLEPVFLEVFRQVSRQGYIELGEKAQKQQGGPYEVNIAANFVYSRLGILDSWLAHNVTEEDHAHKNLVE